MAQACTYNKPNTPPCLSQATHQAQRLLGDSVWRPLPTQERTLGAGVTMMRFDVPEFCETHAEVVAAHRNAPVPRKEVP